MSTSPKSPGGKPQGTTSHGATPRKSGNHKAPKTVAAEQTGAAKSEEVAHTAKAPAEEAAPRAKTPAAGVAKKAKAPAPEVSQTVKASDLEAAKKAKAAAAEATQKPKAPAAKVAKKAEAPAVEPEKKTKVPASALGKKTVASAPVPELSGDTVKSAMDTIERSWKAAGLGTVAVNRKILDFAQQNVSSGLHLARSLAGAKSPVEMARLHVTFWDEQIKALASQAEQLRALSAEVVSKASEPLREHMRKSLSGSD
jgi:hypothetical protein